MSNKIISIINDVWPSWAGTGIALATIGDILGIISAIFTIGYTIYRVIREIKNDK